MSRKGLRFFIELENCCNRDGCQAQRVGVALMLTAKKVISKYQAEKNNGYSYKSVWDKKHDCHANGNPKQDETDHSLHINTSKKLLVAVYSGRTDAASLGDIFSKNGDALA